MLLLGLTCSIYLDKLFLNPGKEAFSNISIHTVTASLELIPVFVVILLTIVVVVHICLYDMYVYNLFKRASKTNIQLRCAVCVRLRLNEE